MIGLDTNVLIRYMVQDDPGQSAIAIRVVALWRFPTAQVSTELGKEHIRSS